MRLVFVDHAFHAKTRSSHFFRDLLAQFHELEEIQVDPDAPVEGVERALAARAEIVVLWQMDYLAPIFIARRLPTVVVPMYDGSGGMPDLHWLWSRQARFVNFSRRLHDRLVGLSVPSHRVKYFPEPRPESELATFEKLRGFLWQRQPEHGISALLVNQILGGRLASLHVHDVPDDPKVSSVPHLRGDFPFRLTTSKWFKSAEQYLATLSEANIFICPRRGEGIGIAMLEAMSRGMLVLAPDHPVHDEYIANWLNGILFNPDAPGEVQLDSARAREIGYMAWKTVERGHREWQDGLPRLLDFVASTPVPKPTPEVDAAQLATGLCRAYTSGLEAYWTYLFTHLDLAAQFADEDLHHKVSRSGEYRPQPQKTPPVAPVGGSVSLWLSRNRLSPGELVSGAFSLSGAFREYKGIAWIVHHGASLGFRIDPSLGISNNLRLVYRCPDHGEEAKLCVVLNGWTLWNDRVAGPQGELVMPLPAGAITVQNTLLLQADRVAFQEGSGDPVSIGIQEIALV